MTCDLLLENGSILNVGQELTSKEHSKYLNQFAAMRRL